MKKKGQFVNSNKWWSWGQHMQVADMWARAMKGYPPDWLGLTPPGKAVRIKPSRLLLKSWNNNRLDAISRARRVLRLGVTIVTVRQGQ